MNIQASSLASTPALQTANQDAETTLSYASVMGIKKDINLVNDDYQWLGSMFYFGEHLLSLQLNLDCRI